MVGFSIEMVKIHQLRRQVLNVGRKNMMTDSPHYPFRGYMKSYVVIYFIKIHLYHASKKINFMCVCRICRDEASLRLKIVKIYLTQNQRLTNIS